MDVYFVRHGQTALNAKRVHQSPATPLSPHGRDQALSVAETLRPLNATLLLTSEYQRTQETARIIGLRIGITPEVSHLFHEVRRPVTLYEKSHFHPQSFWYVLRFVLHAKNSKWRMKDAENFSDLSMRAEQALKALEGLSVKHESVIVVSHAIFINMLAVHMCTHGPLRLRDLVPLLLHIFTMKNCGIVHLKYDPKAPKGTCVWSRVQEG